MSKVVAISLLVVTGVSLLGVFRFYGLAKASQKMDNPSREDFSCPDKPNCVSSEATGSHYIEALPAGTSLTAIANGMKQLGIEIVSQDDSYIHGTHRSGLFGFVDDIQVRLPVDSNRAIAVRSASRVGHSDLGVNQKRVEALRDLLEDRD